MRPRHTVQDLEALARRLFYCWTEMKATGLPIGATLIEAALVILNAQIELIELESRPPDTSAGKARSAKPRPTRPFGAPHHHLDWSGTCSKGGRKKSTKPFH
jgi:hypothetical protein